MTWVVHPTGAGRPAHGVHPRGRRHQARGMLKDARRRELEVSEFPEEAPRNGIKLSVKKYMCAWHIQSAMLASHASEEQMFTGKSCGLPADRNQPGLILGSRELIQKDPDLCQ